MDHYYHNYRQEVWIDYLQFSENEKKKHIIIPGVSNVLPSQVTCVCHKNAKQSTNSWNILLYSSETFLKTHVHVMYTCNPPHTRIMNYHEIRLRINYQTLWIIYELWMWLKTLINYYMSWSGCKRLSIHVYMYNAVTYSYISG